MSLRSFALTLVLATVTTSQASAIATPVVYVPPVYDCAALVALADIFAIDVLGYTDQNNNGIPDYRETFIPGVSDCSSISAQFDDILRLMGEAGVLNANQAAGACQIRGGDHAANYVPWCGVVDVTPLSPHQPSIGEPWYPFPPGTTLIPDGYPDPGETVDPVYSGPTDPPTEPVTPQVSNPPPQDPPALSPPLDPCPQTRSGRCRRRFFRFRSQ